MQEPESRPFDELAALIGKRSGFLASRGHSVYGFSKASTHVRVTAHREEPQLFGEPATGRTLLSARPRVFPPPLSYATGVEFWAVQTGSEP